MSSISKKRKREFLERGKIFLGYGFSKDFKPLRGQSLMEEGRRVFSVPADWHCRNCDGASCKRCRWTGTNPKYLIERDNENEMN